jgi:hypothetical protein
VSDAVAVQVMVVPITCGDLGDGVIVRICTAAEAGTDNAASSPMRYKELVLGVFMEFLYKYHRGSLTLRMRPQ